MTPKDTDTGGVDGAFNRRDILKGIGGASAIVALAPVAAARPDRADRVIVGTRPGRADVARAQAREVIKTLDFGRIGQAVVGRWPPEALAGLARNPHVRYIEEDGIVTIEADHGQTLDWGAERVGAHATHAFGHTGAGISVAILDSGIDSRHEDLVANLHPSLHYAPAPCSDTIGSGDCPEDWHDNDNLSPGHGTHVAGIVGAVNNDIDIVGVAPEATLHAVKVLWGDGEGFESDLADGLLWTADQGIDVANMSLGQRDRSQTVEDAMQYAVDRDVVLVASAGNQNGGAVTFPGGYDQDIAVSAISEEDELSNFSSVGPEVDIAAPGGSRPPQPGRDVLSTRVNGGTVRLRGTSMAAPHVAGAAALLLAAGVAPEDVKQVLQDNAEDLGLESEQQGAGLLNIPAALGITVPIPVEIVIKPGENDDRPINLRHESTIPVAILHTADFDSPALIDPDTVRFGAPETVDSGDGAVPIHVGGHVEDVNDSGLEDWHCHFRVADSGFQAGDTQGKLVGETVDGVPVVGFDDIRIVGRP